MSKPHSTRGLSDLAIKKMKVEDELIDSGENYGLRVKKQARAGVTFTYRYRSPINNKLKQFKIGSYPSMSLAEARVCLQNLKVKRASGVCLATEAKEIKAANKLTANAEISSSSLKVSDLMERYIKDHIEPKYSQNGRVVREGARNIKGQREVRNLLFGSQSSIGRKDKKTKKPMLNDLIGDVFIEDLTHKLVFDAINSVVERGASVSAGNMLRELTAAIDFSIGDGLADDYVNPCYQAKSMFIRKRIRLTSQRGTRFLNDSELARLLEWLPSSAYTPTQKNVLLFTLMTGCRTGEVVNAEWSDIDLDRGIWNLTENKTDSPRDVQLSTQTISMLLQLKRVTGAYLFPSQKTGKPMQQKSLTEQAWHLRRDGRMIDIASWTPHDLRRSVRTGLARIGCPTEVAEAILGHSKSGIEGVYNLHQYQSEARAWLQKWNDHLDNLSFNYDR